MRGGDWERPQKKNQKAAETIETVKKKRAYVRKAQKSELQGDSEPNKNKE
jgi:hypothetical protein